MDEVKGNFGVSEAQYAANATIQEANPLEQLITSNVKALVEQQQYFFDMLWHNAIPAKQRIKEIEEGLKREFIETIQDPVETEKLLFRLLKSGNEEILIILSTINTFLRYENEGVLQLLIGAVERGVKVNIFVKMEKIIKEKIQKLLKEYSQIQVQYLDKSLQTKVTTLIADRELSLVVELKDDTKEMSNGASFVYCSGAESNL
jgi:phosphatidylserine/phosphatidylglycerophosphate/cardiolipin synthase-like enzyme